MTHTHHWDNAPGGGPLICVDTGAEPGCGVLWPGERLPEPPNDHAGSGRNEPDYVPWHRRVDRMLSELAGLDE